MDAFPMPPAQPQAAPPTPRSLFETEKLPFPPVPPELCAALSAHDRTLFSTRPLTVRPYTLNHFLAEVAAKPDLPAYALIGFDGHGINSWGVHYYLVSDGLALFIQLPWGGAYLDPEAARKEITGLFEWAAMLQAKLQAACKQGRIAPGRRLQVAATRFGEPGWRWLATGADNAATPWNPAGGMKATLLALVDDVLAGKQVAG